MLRRGLCYDNLGEVKTKKGLKFRRKRSSDGVPTEAERRGNGTAVVVGCNLGGRMGARWRGGYDHRHRRGRSLGGRWAVGRKVLKKNALRAKKDGKKFAYLEKK